MDPPLNRGSYWARRIDFLIGVLGELFFKRTQIPDVIWLMIMGVFMGPVTGLVPRSFLEEVAPFFGAVTLVVVLFDGGIKLNITHLIKAAPRSGLIASVGFVGAVTVTALLTMIAHKVGILAEWGWIQGAHHRRHRRWSFFRCDHASHRPK